MLPNRIVFRVDGNTQMGLGHVYRTLSLAEMLQNDFNCRYAVYGADAKVLQIIQGKCDKVYNLPGSALACFLEVLTGNEIVVLDGYHFGKDYQIQIKKKGSKLVCIDDLHKDHFISDVIINHSLTATPLLYSAEKYTKIYTGRDYILLRNEFIKASRLKKEIKQFRNVFVCFGGSDKNYLSIEITAALLQTGIINKINVVLGSSFAGDKHRFNSLDNERVKIFTDLGAAEMVELMNSCDFAIISASTIAYECAAVGLPIITGYYLDHQIGFYSALIDQPNVKGIGSFLTMSPGILKVAISEVEKNYKENDTSFIDGKQQERYLKIFSELATG